MLNPRLAGRYAKSLLDLAIETNTLETVLADVQLLERVCKESPDFVKMLKSPIISSDKKIAIINQIFEGKISALTAKFLHLLEAKGRELNLPEIVETFIKLYNEMKHIKTVNLRTAVPLDELSHSSILSKVSVSLPGVTLKLDAVVDEQLIGGFVVQVDDKLFDASVKKKLADIRSKIVDYSYVSKL